MWAKLLRFYSLIPFCFCILLSFYLVIFWYFFFPCAGVDSGRALRQKLNSKLPLGNCLTDCWSNHCGYRRYLYHQGTQKRTLAASKVALPGLGSYLRGNRSLLTAHRAPCAENAIINVKVIGASQEMSNYLPLPSKSCQWLKGGAGRSETLEHRHSPTNISQRLWSSEK